VLCVLGFLRSFLLFLGSGFVRALLYTAYVRRDALRFFNKIALLLIKKRNKAKIWGNKLARCIYACSDIHMYICRYIHICILCQSDSNVLM